MVLFQLVLSGILQGGMYALLSLGLTLTLGVMRIVDLSYGAFYTLGAYFTFYFLINVGVHFILAAIISIVLVLALGLLTERFLIRPIRADDVSVMIMTFAFAYALEEIVKFVFGTPFRTIPPYAIGTFNLGSVFLEKQRVFSFLVALLIIFIILVILKRFKIGRAIRMVAQDRQGANYVGIDVDRVQQITFGVGTVLAASASVLLSPIYLIFPSMGWSPLLKVFGMVILGGMGSVKGTIFAGFLLGLVEVFTSYFIAETLSEISFFMVIILVLLVKPSGLFGTSEGVFK